jgi:hypothetical protein
MYVYMYADLHAYVYASFIIQCHKIKICRSENNNDSEILIKMFLFKRENSEMLLDFLLFA